MQAQTKRLEADLAHLNRELGEARQRADQEAKAKSKLAGDLDRAQADNQRLSDEIKRAGESAKQAKTAPDLGGKKIAKLETALDEERQAHTSAEREAAELRVQVATLTERTARVDELQDMSERLSS